MNPDTNLFSGQAQGSHGGGQHRAVDRQDGPQPAELAQVTGVRPVIQHPDQEDIPAALRP